MAKEYNVISADDWESIIGMAALALSSDIKLRFRRFEYGFEWIEYNTDGIVEYLKFVDLSNMFDVLDNLDDYELGRSKKVLEGIRDGEDLSTLDVFDASNWVQAATFGEVIYG